MTQTLWYQMKDRVSEAIRASEHKKEGERI